MFSMGGGDPTPEFMRVDYDIERVMAGIRESELPDEFAEILRMGGVDRYVLNSILQCDDAPGVSHFVDKAETEAELRKLGVPLVAIRLGAFLDQADDFLAANVQKNAFIGSATATQAAGPGRTRRTSPSRSSRRSSPTRRS